MTQSRPDLAIEKIIPPEIKNDPFYSLIVSLCQEEKLTNVLEIGSSSGAGSTEAFVRGLSANKGTPHLFCLEISRTRFQKLAETYKQYPFVKPYNASSVGSDCLPSEQDVSRFHGHYKLPLRLNNLERVLQWLKEDRDYIEKHSGVEPEGIELIKRENGIDKFDMVLIDGSEFLGSAELERVYGARIILLDDTRTYKTFECVQRLKNDPDYELIVENHEVRNGYAAFRRREQRPKELPIHFFTIVLNGKPFIDYHIDMMRRLPFRWTWHIVEGVADLVHDTAWSRKSGGCIPDELHKDGLSNDGTSEYIDQLAREFPGQVKIYRKGGGKFWDGKREMCNAPLPEIAEDCLLWQLDNDELWTVEQVTRARQMFLDNPDRTAAFYWCSFFFGADRIISTRNCYAQNPNMEWLRTWRFSPGMRWAAHEPPVLAAPAPDGTWQDQARIKPFMHEDTEKAGLVFQHFAYATRTQVEFKEAYYGYKGAVDRWELLQAQDRLPVPLKGLIPWVNDHTQVDRAAALGVDPLASADATGKWTFRYLEREPSLEVIEGKPNIIIDGVFFQYYRTGIARVWNSLLKEWAGTDFARRLVVLDRGRTMDRVPGITYLNVTPHNYAKQEDDRKMLEYLCRTLGAGAFTSTYYSHPEVTPNVMLVHDMIPEVMGMNTNEPMWVEKRHAIEMASHFVCVSKNTATDLMRVFPAVTEDAVTIAYNGLAGVFRKPDSDSVERFRRRYGINSPYFMLSGARGGYKNGMAFFRAFNRFPVHNAFEVFCTGPQALDHAERDMVDGSRAQHARLDDDEMAAAYAGAVALVVPSAYEGFGLPVLEAMACGCPVLCSNASSLPEVAGGAALLFDPRQVDEIADCMAEVLKPTVRERLIPAGLARADEFSWKRMADKFRTVLEAVADGRSAGADSGSSAASALPDAKEALRLINTGKILEAVRVYDDLAAAGQCDLSTLNDRAVAHFQLGRKTGLRDEALRSIALLEELLRAHPDHLNAWKNLVFISGALGDTVRQREGIERILALNPGDPDASAALSQLNS